MARAGLRKVQRYSPEFKLTAVRLSRQPGIQVQAVAAALDIHPFMLSKWRKQVRDGVLRGTGRDLRAPPPREIRRLQELERAYALLQEEARAPKKSHPVLCRTKADRFAFLATQCGAFSVTRLCALLGVTRAGYYAWRRRPESAHAAQDRQVTRRMVVLFRAHRGRYGSPRLCRELRSEGWRVSRRRVERLMRRAGLRARVVRVYRANPALHRFYDQHPNRLPRGGARRPDQVWVGDITYLPVGRQWRFLAVVLDQCSRRVLAWAVGRRRDARLTRAVLDAAVRRRQPPGGVVFHSDRGSEYAAAAFRDRVVAVGARQSAAQRGPEDNAHMESFFHSLKAELVHGTRFATEAALRQAVRSYIRYYNHRRRHSALGYRSPADFEADAA